MKRGIWLLMALAVLAALTAPAAGTTGRIYREPNGAVTVYDLAPGSRVRFGTDTAPTRRYTANSCGVVRVRRNEVIQLEGLGTLIDPSALPTQLLPRCRNGVLEEARSGPFKTRDGDIILPNLMPNTRYQVAFPSRFRLFTRRVNACGFLRVRETNTITFNERLMLPTATPG
jgi:hypothetical protein